MNLNFKKDLCRKLLSIILHIEKLKGFSIIFIFTFKFILHNFKGTCYQQCHLNYKLNNI